MRLARVEDRNVAGAEADRDSELSRRGDKEIGLAHFIVRPRQRLRARINQLVASQDQMNIRLVTMVLRMPLRAWLRLRRPDLAEPGRPFRLPASVFPRRERRQRAVRPGKDGENTGGNPASGRTLS